MKIPLAPLALSVALGLAAAGCGGGQMGGAPTAATPPAPPGEAQGGRVVVDIRDLAFMPDRVTVPAGGTVVFTNSDRVSHTITKKSGPGPDFDSGPVEPGGTFQQTFPDKGKIQVLDKSRPETTLTITVE